MKKLIYLFLCMLPVATMAQVHIDFGNRKLYKAVGVYDTWEESPFRTGVLEGRTAVMKNPFPQDRVPAKVLAVQCSRHGSNTFGVRIDLKEPFAISPKTQYVHVLLHKPVAGRVMLVGLGKRSERVGQSAEAEQCWVFSSTPVAPGKWSDAVFAVRGNEGVEIHSLVVVPQCESPHNRTQDFAAYVGDVQVDHSAESRLTPTEAYSSVAGNNIAGSHCLISSNSRNGDVVTPDDKPLNRMEVPVNKKFQVKVVPSRGFGCAGLRISRADDPSIEPLLIPSVTLTQEHYVLPAHCMQGRVMVEGLFVEIP